MKINLAKSAGFCFGVKRAIKIALNTAKNSQVTEILGDIVHNEDVVREIQKAGIKKIKQLKNGNGKILLIRAHGTPMKIIEKAIALGYNIIDATCPMVKEIHKIAKNSEAQGYKIIVIGDKHHDEVKGIVGQLKNKAMIIDATSNIPLAKIKRIKKAAVVVQSTQNIEKVLEIVKSLKQYIRELKFFDTVCRPTRMKQDEIRIMPLNNDIMIIIGSKTSANTQRLYEISRSLNRRSFWIQSKKEIKPEWFRDVKFVGITAGASTPNSTTNDIIAYIKMIA